MTIHEDSLASSHQYNLNGVAHQHDQNTSSSHQDINMTEPLDDSRPIHPLGVLPLGNQYLSERPKARSFAGTLQIFPDEMLMTLLEYLDHHALRRFGYTCKFLYAFTHANELWKACFLECHNDGKFSGNWLGSWRSTLLELPSDRESRISCSNVFSDVLHRPFVCGHVDLSPFSTGIPKENEIQKLRNLSYEEFADDWTETPFVLTNCIQSWPVYKEWSMEEMLRKYGQVEFRAEAVDWPFSTYYDYMKSTNDESPLYLFDKKFAEKMGITIGQHGDAAYWRPECFGPDLFEILGQERPAHRWLIVGPERSGSTFHKDPNATSAWNAVVQGAKYWIMFPPTAQVPGVYVSKDSSEVTSPLSIAEWLLEFHAEARTLPECIEGVCHQGEILHVPSGWWHLVVNLEDGIALTQNFVPKSPSLHHLSEALSFLRDKPDQVTGFKKEIEDPYALFEARLRDSYPEALEEALQVLEKKASAKKRKWEEAVGGQDAETAGEGGGGGGGFSFGFGGDDLDDDEIP